MAHDNLCSSVVVHHPFWSTDPLLASPVFTEDDDDREHDPTLMDEDDVILKLLQIPAPIYADEDQLCPPESILLESYDYASDRENQSTTRGRTSDDDRI